MDNNPMEQAIRPVTLGRKKFESCQVINLHLVDNLSSCFQT
nr:hypothetical protein [Prevotella multiformis]